MAEAVWYYQQGAQPVGPLSTAELCQKFSSGELPLETNVYSESVGQWVAAQTIAGFRDAVPKAGQPAAAPPAAAAEPLIAPTPPAAEQPAQFAAPPATTLPVAPTVLPYATPVGDQPHPWVRFFARTIDIMIGMGVLLVLSYVIWPPHVAARNLGFGGGLLLYFCWVFIESVLLSTVGTTPGKSLLGIRVINAAGRAPSFGQALARSFGVWIGGLGMGLPAVSLITQIVSYNKLVANGETKWDRNNHLVVRHAPCGAGRIVLGLTAGFGCYFAILLFGTVLATLQTPIGPRTTLAAPSTSILSLKSGPVVPVVPVQPIIPVKKVDPRVGRISGTWFTTSTARSGSEHYTLRNILTLNDDGTFRQSVRVTDSLGSVRTDLGHQWSGTWEFDRDTLVETVSLSSTPDYPIGRWVYQIVVLKSDAMELRRTIVPEGFVTNRQKPLYTFRRMGATVRSE